MSNLLSDLGSLDDLILTLMALEETRHSIDKLSRQFSVLAPTEAMNSIRREALNQEKLIEQLGQMLQARRHLFEDELKMVKKND